MIVITSVRASALAMYGMRRESFSVVAVCSVAVIYAAMQPHTDEHVGSFSELRRRGVTAPICASYSPVSVTQSNAGTATIFQFLS